MAEHQIAALAAEEEGQAALPGVSRLEVPLPAAFMAAEAVQGPFVG
jgi:hypothetical protein